VVGSVAAFSYAAGSTFNADYSPFISDCARFILFLKAVVLIPVTLLPILNPLGIAPVFANLLGNVSRSTESASRARSPSIAGSCWWRPSSSARTC
jgi:multiple antibiotic resistance protein